MVKTGSLFVDPATAIAVLSCDPNLDEERAKSVLENIGSKLQETDSYATLDSLGRTSPPEPSKLN